MLNLPAFGWRIFVLNSNVAYEFLRRVCQQDSMHLLEGLKAADLATNNIHADNFHKVVSCQHLDAARRPELMPKASMRIPSALQPTFAER